MIFILINFLKGFMEVGYINFHRFTWFTFIYFKDSFQMLKKNSPRTLLLFSKNSMYSLKQTILFSNLLISLMSLTLSLNISLYVKDVTLMLSSLETLKQMWSSFSGPLSWDDTSCEFYEILSGILLQTCMQYFLEDVLS